MLIYFTIDNHVPLYPWNNLDEAGPRWPSTLAGWVPGLLTIWALARGPCWAVTLGAGWTVVWLLLQLRQWWVPYLFGPTPLHSDFNWYWRGGSLREPPGVSPPATLPAPFQGALPRRSSGH